MLYLHRLLFLVHRDLQLRMLKYHYLKTIEFHFKVIQIKCVKCTQQFKHRSTGKTVPAAGKFKSPIGVTQSQCTLLLNWIKWTNIKVWSLVNVLLYSHTGFLKYCFRSVARCTMGHALCLKGLLKGIWYNVISTYLSSNTLYSKGLSDIDAM